MLFSTTTAAAYNESIAITVYNYPPDIINAESEPQGEFIEKLLAILHEADLSVDWLRIGMHEESQMLNEGTRPFCTTGRLYSEERGQAWAFLPYVFSTIQHDIIVVTKEKAPQIEEIKNHSELLTTPKWTGVFVEGGYYGGTLDKIIAQKRPWHSTVGRSDEHVLKLLSSGRGDYSIIPSSVWNSVKIDAQYSTLTSIAGKATGGKPNQEPEILLACSKAVEHKTLEKIAAAMDRLGHPRSEKAIISPVS